MGSKQATLRLRAIRREQVDINCEWVPWLGGGDINVGLLDKFNELRPKVKGSVDSSAPQGVIIRDAPSSSGVEHEISSTCTQVMDGQVKEFGGRGVEKVLPQGDKHVPHIISSYVMAPKRNYIGHNVAKVWSFVKQAMGVKEHELREGKARVDSLFKE